MIVILKVEKAKSHHICNNDTNQVEEEAGKEGPHEIARYFLNRVSQTRSEVKEDDKCHREKPRGKHPPLNKDLAKYFNSKKET